jgi:hypothetical protein
MRITPTMTYTTTTTTRRREWKKRKAMVIMRTVPPQANEDHSGNVLQKNDEE